MTTVAPPGAGATVNADANGAPTTAPAPITAHAPAVTATRRTNTMRTTHSVIKYTFFAVRDMEPTSAHHDSGARPIKLTRNRLAHNNAQLKMAYFTPR
ncbi:hypothetical protein GCM10009619_41590 [Williamsia maris]